MKCIPVTYDWPTILPAAIAAFVFSFLGSRTVALLNTAYLRPIVLVLLVLVAIYVFFVKDLGLIHQPKHRPQKAQWLGILIGAALGFLRRLLRSGHGQLPHLSFRWRVRFRFSRGLRLRQGRAIAHHCLGIRNNHLQRTLVHSVRKSIVGLHHILQGKVVRNELFRLKLP